MEKETLKKSAEMLNQISESSYQEYLIKSDNLVARINAGMLERTDINELVGEKNITMMKDNHANHVRFMASLFKLYNPDIFLDTVLWVFRAYRSHEFTPNYWAAQLSSWFAILKQVLTERSYTEIYPYYEWMQINIPAFVSLSDEEIKLNKSKDN